ncbi:MAG TPA: hypothetical protein VM580_19865 [Labilithrix sp.]|nr:hypothetical protein [Labilithrix sp.]
MSHRSSRRVLRLVACAGLSAIAPALALLGCEKKPIPEEIATEIARREALAKRVLLEADAGRALGMSSRSDVVFEDGFSRLLFDPPDDYHNHAFRWMGTSSHARLRTHGDRRMKLRAVGWVDEKVLRTHPVLTAYIDGRVLGIPVPPIDNGFYWFEAEVPPDMLAGKEWVDLNMVLSSVAFHWHDPPNLAVAVVFRFDWEEVSESDGSSP